VAGPTFSAFYGWIQSKSVTKKKIVPFIQKFGLDPEEFITPPDQFASFNDFFIRKLKKEARPIDQRDFVFVAPCDGRFHLIENLSLETSFILKETLFDLKQLLKREEWAQKYEGGSMVMARLCPFDYHRFHFPCDGRVTEMDAVGEKLHSVNPLAVEVIKTVYWENKRLLTLIETENFGDVMMIEVGATNVGTIHETFKGPKVKKGEEKGYFSFGGSAILILFEKGAISFDKDLSEYTKKGMEVRLEMGDSLGFSTC
jgi:phosphatidylserine decarboxylase